jgi:hypothetical protein
MLIANRLRMTNSQEPNPDNFPGFQAVSSDFNFGPDILKRAIDSTTPLQAPEPTGNPHKTRTSDVVRQVRGNPGCAARRVARVLRTWGIDSPPETLLRVSASCRSQSRRAGPGVQESSGFFKLTQCRTLERALQGASSTRRWFTIWMADRAKPNANSLGRLNADRWSLNAGISCPSPCSRWR